MNDKIILGMVEPYVKNGTITYVEFDNLFSMLSLKEQYRVVDIIQQHDIELIDGIDELENIDNIEKMIEGKDFETLYDNVIFSKEYGENLEENQKKNIDDRSKEQLFVRSNISIPNRTLIKLIQDGNRQAKQDLCIKNRGLVDKIAYVYMKMAGNKLDFEDLQSVGMIGLLKAAEKFDLSSENQFSTYATWWIRQSIIREIMNNGFSVRIPVHRMEQILKVTKFDSEFAEEVDYRKRITRIAKESGYDEELIEYCLQLYHQFLKTASLDVPVGEEEDSVLEDFIEDGDEISVEDIAMFNILREELEKAISTLKPREQTVLRLRFGLDDGSEKTLEEIGQEVGVTRERIRQIEQKTLRKLRNSLIIQKLKDCFD